MFYQYIFKKGGGGTSPNPPDPFFLSEIRLSLILVPVILMVLKLVPVILVVLILVPRLLKISTTNFSGTNFSTRKKKLTKI